jgi:diguanylate cyclase (GGDEF)-like protein
LAADKPNVISLKRLIDAHPGEQLNSALEAYRTALGAMARSGARACPHLGGSIESSLLALQEKVSREASPSELSATGERADAELAGWGERAAGYFKDKAEEVKELMLVVASTAEALGERDERYATEFSQFSARLQQIANLDDLGKIRSSILESASELKECVGRMAQDSEQSVSRLRAQVTTYEKRLEETERLATRDALTGLENRRKLELLISQRAAAGQPFSVLLLDMNGFKQVNDQYGHSAGDDLLKQFAAELRAQVRRGDAVGRWGGDEFVVVLDGSHEDAEAQLERIRKWACGDYTLATPTGPVKVHVGAAAGLVAWKRGETVAEVVARADAAMYQDKKRTSSSSKR